MLSRRLAVLLLLALACLSFGDDGWWSTSGGLERYGKGHPTIRMVAEDLKIKVLDDKEADVNVVFTFRNEGPATHVVMAFPETYQMRVGESLRNFRTWVDGRRVPASRKVISEGDSRDEDYGDRTGEAVWRKSVTFKAHQTLKVRVSYQGFVSGDTSGGRSFSYVLTTGASWKGPIGRCKITVSWPRTKKLGSPYLHLPPADWHFSSPRKASALLVNWKPKDNLELDFVPRFGNFWINGKQLEGDGNRSWHPTTTWGRPSDPLIRAAGLGHFFGPGVKDKDWGSAAQKWFGGPFTIAHGVVKLHSGQTVKLARGSRLIGSPGQKVDADEDTFVYLKDLIKALGGKFYYNGALERVEIWFPRTKPRPSAPKS